MGSTLRQFIDDGHDPRRALGRVDWRLLVEWAAAALSLRHGVEVREQVCRAVVAGGWEYDLLQRWALNLLEAPSVASRLERFMTLNELDGFYRSVDHLTGLVERCKALRS